MMNDSSGESKSIPLSDLADFFNEQSKEHDSLKKSATLIMKGILSDTYNNDAKDDENFALGRVAGSNERLVAFEAFLRTHAADLSGNLNPDQAKDL